MKVAIVGTGIAGATAGWLLNRAGHEVILLDKLPRLGMDAHSVDLKTNETTLRADLPPRMFNRSLWPNLFRLYESIGAEIEPVDLSSSFGEGSRKSTLTFANPYAPRLQLNALFRPDAWRVARDIWRMKSQAPADIANGAVKNTDFGTYLEHNSYSSTFVDKFLFPSLASTVCTCSYASLRSYPADIILKAMLALIERGGLFRARHGAGDVARRLTANIPNVLLGRTVEYVTRAADSVRLKLDTGDTIFVDHLIVATQANSAVKLLSDINTAEREMLHSFTYEDIEVLVHEDVALMPSRRRDWSQFNFVTNQQFDAAMCTVWMNRFRPDWKLAKPVFQTICPISEPAPERLICRRHLQRPVVNEKSIAGYERLRELHQEPGRRVWFCGSYASPGVPLLESGVVSSISVARLLNVGLPTSMSGAGSY